MRLAKNKSKTNCLKLGLKAFKAVLFRRLISLHRRNETAAQGKSQSHKAKTSMNRSQSSLYNTL